MGGASAIIISIFFCFFLHPLPHGTNGNCKLSCGFLCWPTRRMRNVSSGVQAMAIAHTPRGHVHDSNARANPSRQAKLQYNLIINHIKYVIAANVNGNRW